MFFNLSVHPSILSFSPSLGERDTSRTQDVGQLLYAYRPLHGWHGQIHRRLIGVHREKERENQFPLSSDVLSAADIQPILPVLRDMLLTSPGEWERERERCLWQPNPIPLPDMASHLPLSVNEPKEWEMREKMWKKEMKRGVGGWRCLPSTTSFFTRLLNAYQVKPGREKKYFKAMCHGATKLLASSVTPFDIEKLLVSLAPLIHQPHSATPVACHCDLWLVSLSLRDMRRRIDMFWSPRLYLAAS